MITAWIASLSGKSSSIGNEVIVVRQFLNYLRTFGETVYIPNIPKIREDYVPYIFSDTELSFIFEAADNIIQKDGGKISIVSESTIMPKIAGCLRYLKKSRNCWKPLVLNCNNSFCFSKAEYYLRKN